MNARLLLLLFLVAPFAMVAADAPTAAGITEPILDVTLSAPVSGIISLRKFNEGDLVKEGDVILELDKKLEELEAERRKLVAVQKKSDFDSTALLFKNTKGVSKDELEKKEVESRVATVEHEMSVEQLRRRHVAAPLSGAIAEIFLHVGEACQPYQPLVRVVDTRRCFFVSNVEAKAAANLKLGQTVKLEIDSGTAPVAIEGKISFLSPVVEPASGLQKVKVIFDNADGRVRPGLAGKMILY